jgi:hypothetical protein
MVLCPLRTVELESMKTQPQEPNCTYNLGQQQTASPQLEPVSLTMQPQMLHSQVEAALLSSPESAHLQTMQHPGPASGEHPGSPLGVCRVPALPLAEADIKRGVSSVRSVQHYNTPALEAAEPIAWTDNPFSQVQLLSNTDIAESLAMEQSGLQSATSHTLLGDLLQTCLAASNQQDAELGVTADSTDDVDEFGGFVSASSPTMATGGHGTINDSMLSCPAVAQQTSSSFASKELARLDVERSTAHLVVLRYPLETTEATATLPPPPNTPCFHGNRMLEQPPATPQLQPSCPTHGLSKRLSKDNQLCSDDVSPAMLRIGTAMAGATLIWVDNLLTQ